MRQLVMAFPKLAAGGYRITSPVDPAYNSGIHERTLSAFFDLFFGSGFQLAYEPGHEEGWLKVALFAKDQLPTHAARQLPSGLWTSKIGSGPDIEHRLEDLEGAIYGNVVQIFKKKQD